MKYLVLNHIPRCGGSSLKRSFFEAYKTNDYFSPYPAYISEYTHNNICLYEQPELMRAIHPETILFIDHSKSFFVEESFNLDLADTYRVLTIRHPLKRIISHICYFYKRPVEQLPVKIIKEYLQQFGNLTLEYLTDFKYVGRSTQEKLHIAMSIILEYNFIFQVEKQKLMEEFNSTNPFRLQLANYHINRATISSTNTDQLPQQLKNLIYEYIKPEIQLLENFYEMDL